HCTACGVPTPTDDAKNGVVLQSRKKTFTDDGGHRVLTPSETLRKYERHISPITGAVGALQRHPSADDGVMHVYTAGDNLAAFPRSLKDVRWNLRSRSTGKGVTDVQARASALCESLERYSGTFQGTEPRRKSSFKELGGAAI